MLKTISLTVLSLLIVGCGSTNQTTLQPKVSVKQTTHKVIKTKKSDNTPKWILNPNKANYICSIGSAPITDEKTTKTIAKLKAKANIGKQITIYINKQSRMSKDNNGKSSFQTTSSQQSTNMLRGIKVSNTYTDKPNNRFYIRMCSKI